ncbi:MAG: hypothetical protein OEV44_10710 [Spirochaetota bacterium]|nr:hypothetical protein [Spirochaetota bacterium]
MTDTPFQDEILKELKEFEKKNKVKLEGKSAYEVQDLNIDYGDKHLVCLHSTEIIGMLDIKKDYSKCSDYHPPLAKLIKGGVTPDPKNIMKDFYAYVI